MLGPVEYVGGAVLIAAVSWGSLTSLQVDRLQNQIAEQAVETAQARGALETCAERVSNLQEAMRSNASIPDDLRDFDVPDGWILPSPKRNGSAAD